MSTRSRRSISWIALAAMLFSAVSPAFAAVLLRDQPSVLARMLAIPVPAQHAKAEASNAAAGSACHVDEGAAAHEGTAESSHRGAAGHDGSTDTDHARHGVVCSFCLPASSLLALSLAGPVALPTVAAETHVVPGEERSSDRTTPALHPARGPPATS